MRILRPTKLIAKAGLAKVRRALLGPHATAVLCDSPVNGRLLVPPDDVTVGRRLAWEGAYDRERIETLLALLRQLPPGAEALVVGAHVGALVVPLARSGAPVTAVEANPEVCALLRMNVTLNALDDVEVHNLAALDRRGMERFLVSRANSGGSKVAPRRDRFLYRYDRPREVEVQAAPLDAVLDGRTYGLVVMDVEGSEHRAALGMRRLLRAARVLMVEFVPHHLRDVAGITVEQWAEPFVSAFPWAALPIEGNRGMRWVAGQEATAALERLHAADRSADLFFARERYDGVA